MVKVKEIIPLSEVRKKIAKKMLLSAKEIPQVTLIMEVFMDEAVKIKESLSQKGYRISLTDIVIKAVAEALREFKLFNSRFEGDIKILDSININVAVDTDYGLVTPVVKEADKKTLIEISLETQDLIRRARSHKLSISDVVGGTFTVTNLGMMGVDLFNPLINPPQVAILGIGSMKKVNTIKDESIKVKYSMNLCLTFDHRVVDGAYAAKFLLKIKEFLENPSTIMGSVN